MKEHIIDSPHLQSLLKRISGVVVWAIGWLMWIYLLVPLMTLSSWLLGDKTLADEMRWFGGYKSLLELLEIYFVTLLALAALWLCWVFSHLLRKRNNYTDASRMVNDMALCRFYQVNNDALQQCRHASMITVYFDDHGHITRLEPGDSADPIISKASVAIKRA